MDGDLIMYICGKYLKEQGKLKDNMVVTTVMSNLGLYKALEREGMQYVKTAVGDKYVSENMLANGWNRRGTVRPYYFQSLFSDRRWYPHLFDADGDFGGEESTLHDLAKEVKIYPQLLKNVRVSDKKTARENPRVIEAVDQVAKELGDEGRILVRESGTEPVIRVMVEAATDELCGKYVDQVISVIEAEGLTVS